MQGLAFFKFQLVILTGVLEVLVELPTTICDLDPCLPFLLKAIGEVLGPLWVRTVNASFKESKLPSPLKDACNPHKGNRSLLWTICTFY